MGILSSSSLSIKFALILSLSLTSSHSVSSSSYPRSFLKPQSTLSCRQSKSSTPKASASDLLSLLGTPQQASSINPQVARQLKSCFKFLVPFIPTCKPGLSQLVPLSPTLRRTLGSIFSRGDDCSKREDDQLVWWPPAPVMELARLAVDSCGDLGSIQRTLDPTMIPVPDIEGSNEDRCQLTRTPYGRRFINEELNLYMKFLFEMIGARGPNVGLSVSLNRYDFFHGHLFVATDGRLGILFHAKEYPAYEKEVFPCNMGFCQVGSNVTYDESMNLRNILWLAPLPSDSSKAWLAPGVLVVLDAHPGGIIYRDLIPEYVDLVRTLYEEDFGDAVVDVNYLNIGCGSPDYQIFIC